MNSVTNFPNLDALATDLRTKLEAKKNLLLFAYNGTGKTRLSMAFKDVGKQGSGRDTLYFNAFTEDLFTWDNDLENDSQRMLHLNKVSNFFASLEELEMESRIRPFLHPLVSFDFKINPNERTIRFFRDDDDDPIKISRGEERIFVWCFFLAIAKLAIDAQEGQAYDWVKYLYIDDPISSLDDNNAIAVASRLAQMLKGQNKVKTVVSSHHTLFFNVLCNELNNAIKLMLTRGEVSDSYDLRTMSGDTARFYHVAMLKEIKQAADAGTLYTYHFGILRNLLEKTATFHGFTNFGDCLPQNSDDEEGVVRKRIINIMNHGNYSLFEPIEMLPENKKHFKNTLDVFMSTFRFNPDLFSEDTTPEAQT